MVLEGTFPVAIDVVQSFVPIIPERWVVHKLASHAAAAAACAPHVFQLHGTRDRTVSLKLGARVAVAMLERRENATFVAVPGGTHGLSFVDSALQEAFAVFVEEALAGGSADG